MKLTLPQQDVYFEQLLYPNDPIYNIGARVVVRGPLNVELLQEAYVALIDQHDAYRSVVVQKEKVAEIEFLEKHNSVLELVDFSNESNPDLRANAYMQELFVRPFDLGKRQLLHSFILVKVSDTFHYIFSMYHHIITDGWGTSLMFQRWVKNYNELTEFGSIQSEYTFSYSDFVADDLEYQASEAYQTDKDYWVEKFKELPQPLFEKLDSSVHINKSKREVLMIKRATYKQLESLAKEHRCSTFHVILGILYLYFGKRQQNNDFAIGLPVLNRGKSIFKKTVGLFMGVAALRIKPNPHETFEMLLQNIRQQLRQDYRHQRFPIGKLIQELKIFQEKDRLFNLTLSYEKQNYADHFKDTQTTVIPMTHGAERVALAIYIREFDETEDVKIDFDYHTNYFIQESIKEVVGHFQQLIRAILKEPGKQIRDYEYLTENELELLHSFNPAPSKFRQNKTFIDYFKEQVLLHPDKTALRDPLESYSYLKLEALTNSVAIAINTHFGDHKAAIPVLMDRSANLIVVLLGILKSGRAFIPLDPQFPPSRISFILNHSGTKSIISTPSHALGLPADLDVFNADEMIYSEGLTSEKPIKIDPAGTAYIIYTSGSTGKPKGVAVGHQALLNFLLSIKETPGMGSKDLLYSVTTQSFDISILEFFTPLIAGATVHVSDKDTLTSPIHLLEDLSMLEPTVVQGTPSFFQMLFNAGWEGDSTLKVLCGGDLLSEALAERLLATCGEVWNMYGPTETTIWSSNKRIRSAKDASIIGSAIRNTQLYIFNDDLQLVPVGVVGNLFIGGDGLARGYFKNKKLTDEKFIDNPLNPGTKMYDTGDLARWNNKGELQFHGRIDNQVKIRGYRIELGEIESSLNELDTVKEAVAVAHRKLDEDPILVAYVIASGDNFHPEALRAHLSNQLPAYMIPQIIKPLKIFPLTPNKKVDRKELSQRSLARNKPKTASRKALSELQKKLRTFFQEVLQLDNLPSATDNFFELGGHSLMAVSLINRIEKEFGYALPLRVVFEHTTFTALADYLEHHQALRHKKIVPIAKASSYPMTASQYLLWLGAQQPERSIAYNMSAAYRVEGELNEQHLKIALERLISTHEILRTNFREEGLDTHQFINSSEEINLVIDNFYSEAELVRDTIDGYVHREFDLAQDLLLRVGILNSSQGDQFLIFVTHHIIMDGWSLEILMRELIQNYKNEFSGEAAEIDTPAYQFKDYSAWLEEIAIQQKQKNAQFWKNYLEGYQWKTLLPFDHNPTSNDHQGQLYEFSWDATVVRGIKDLVQEYNTSFHTILVAGLQTLLHLLTTEEDICIGTVNSGRGFVGADQQLGMFVKTLPLRGKIDREVSFGEFLRITHHRLLRTDEHQDVPADILNHLRLDILLVLQNPATNYNNISLAPELTLRALPETIRYSRLPLLFNFMENGDELQGIISFSSSLYDRATIDWLVLKFGKLMRFLIANPGELIREIDLDLEFEKENSIDVNFNF